MESELEDTLVEVLRKGLRVAEQTGDFVVDQAPEVINQLLKWKMFESILYCVLTVSILSFFVVMINYCIKEQWCSQPTIILMVVCGANLCLMVVHGVISGIFVAWLKIMYAPKLYLLEYAARLVK